MGMKKSGLINLAVLLALLGAFLIGLWLDRKVGTKGIFTVALTIFGVIGGGRTVYRLVMDATEKQKEDHTD